MRKLLPAFLLLCFGGGLSAQLTLTADYFPVSGDTLRTVVADSTFAANVEIFPLGGANLAWNFSNALGVRDSNEPVDAVTSEDFPAATLSIRTDNTLSFYQVSETSFDLVGVETEFDFLPNFPLATEVTPARPIRRAPLTFGATFSSVTENSVTISPDSIPAEILAEIGTALNSADSIRITTISNREDAMDAWGTVRLLDNFYPVLREKSTEGVFIRVEVQTLPLPFVDVTGTISILNPNLAALVGQQPETVTYSFWNDESKEPIAVIVTSEETGEVSRMTYKRAQQSTSTGGPGVVQARVQVYPNPATDLATFEIEGLTPGQYALHLVNVSGRRIAMREFTPFGNQTRLSLDVSELPAGLYLYSVINEQGKRIVTKKLQVR